MPGFQVLVLHFTFLSSLTYSLCLVLSLPFFLFAEYREISFRPNEQQNTYTSAKKCICVLHLARERERERERELYSVSYNHATYITKRVIKNLQKVECVTVDFSFGLFPSAKSGKWNLSLNRGPEKERETKWIRRKGQWPVVREVKWHVRPFKVNRWLIFEFRNWKLQVV